MTNSVAPRRQPDCFIGALTWADVAGRIAAGAAALLPIGAGAKEHGLHLPLATDEIQANYLAGELARRLAADGRDLLIWPTLTYGFYPAFRAYAGSADLDAPVFREVVRSLSRRILEFGARPLFILDTGISTIPEVAAAIEGLGEARHLRIHGGPRYRHTADSLRRQAFGSHADELETSRMLVIAPGLVDMAKAVASPLLPGGPKPGPLSPADPSSANYSPSGSFGDPTLANREKGEALLSAMLDDLFEAMR